MSSGIIYALPAPTLPPPAPVAVQTDVIWEGWDGSLWHLTTPETGVVLLNKGVEGFHHPKFRQWTRQSPAVPGQTFTGAIAEPRTILLPVLVFEDTSSQNWINHDQAFWKSFHPAKEGTLTVSPAGTGSRRSIRCRLQPEDHTFAIDPAYAQWAQYAITLIADQPFWRGTPIRGGWSAPAGEEFFEETGPHLININPGHTTSDASVRNPGDEDAWPVWTIIGPSTEAHLGVGDQVVDVPFEVEAGKALVVDTDPRVQTAIEYDYTPPAGTLPAGYANPVDRTQDLTGDVDFAPVPAGERSELNISITGTGTIRLELTPLYWRAW